MTGDEVNRRRGTTWSKEATPSATSLKLLSAGSSSAWALGEDDGSQDVLLQRRGDGTWTIKTPARDAALTSLHALWVAPGGEIFLATDDGMLRSANNGATWSEQEMIDPATVIWGRSGTDAYAASVSGLLHYDGKAWSRTSYSGKTLALGGTAKDVLVVRADE